MTTKKLDKLTEIKQCNSFNEMWEVANAIYEAK